MGSVDIGVGHDDDLVISNIAYIVLFFTHTGAQGGNDVLDLFTTQNFIEPRLFNVQYLAFQG